MVLNWHAAGPGFNPQGVLKILLCVQLSSSFQEHLSSWQKKRDSSIPQRWNLVAQTIEGFSLPQGELRKEFGEEQNLFVSFLVPSELIFTVQIPYLFTWSIVIPRIWGTRIFQCKHKKYYKAKYKLFHEVFTGNLPSNKAVFLLHVIISSLKEEKHLIDWLISEAVLPYSSSKSDTHLT